MIVMLPLALMGAIALFLFRNLDKSSEIEENVLKTTEQKNKTYKHLVTDLMSHHNIDQLKFNKNIRINKTKDGFGIGSNDGFVHVSDSKPIKLYIGDKKYPLNTYDTNEAVEKIKEMITSDKINQEEKKKITTVLNLLLKYKNYYFFKKYNHYKKLYLDEKQIKN
jgi:hypothetical protein